MNEPNRRRMTLRIIVATAHTMGGSRSAGPSLAVGLNGLDAYVEVPNSDAFSQPTSGKGLTVEVWFRPDTISFDGQTSEHYIHWLGKGETDDYEWGLRFYSDAPPRNNRVSAYIWNPTNEVAGQKENLGAGAYFQDPVTVGAWIYVVACYDPGDASNPNAGVSICKNGVFREGPLTSPGARYSQFAIHPVHGAAPVRFGTRDLGSFLRGGLADVAIYPRVLRADEVMDNFRSAGSVQRLGG